MAARERLLRVHLGRRRLGEERVDNMPKENCAALVYASDDQLRRPEYRESFELMKELGRVVNLCDRQTAVEQIALLSG